MALDPKAQAALALHRFGVGARAGSIAAIASDPRGALLAELDGPGAARISDPDLLTSGVDARGAFAYQQAQRAGGAGGRRAEWEAPGAPRSSDPDLLTSGVAARVAFAYQQAQRAARQAERAAQPAMAPGGGGAREMKDQTPRVSAPRPNPGPSLPQQIYLAEAKARINAALAAEIGFAEWLGSLSVHPFSLASETGHVG